MNYNLTDGNRELPYLNERNDCVVRAFATALDIPYYQAHDLCKKYGREDRRRTDTYVVLSVLKHFHLHLNCTQPVPCNMPTLNQFIKEHPAGVYLVHKRGHLFTLKNGMVYDSWKVGKRVKIDWYAKVSGESDE